VSTELFLIGFELTGKIQAMLILAPRHILPSPISKSNLSRLSLLSTQGMIVGSASGILRSIMVTPHNLADIVPVDIVINLVNLNPLNSPPPKKKKLEIIYSYG
jgi:hypothetical protein